MVFTIALTFCLSSSSVPAVTPFLVSLLWQHTLNGRCGGDHTRLVTDLLKKNNNTQILNFTGIALHIFDHYKVNPKQNVTSSWIQTGNRCYLLSMGSLGTTKHISLNRLKRFFFAYLMVSMFLSLLLHSLLSRNCWSKLMLLVFDLALGLYSEADDNTDTGQDKSKFICSVNMWKNGLYCG